MSENMQANQFGHQQMSQSFPFQINSGNLALLYVNYSLHGNKFRHN